MTRVNLYCGADGQDYVATVETVPFKKAPEIITWGSRIFIRINDNRYREGLSHHSNTPARSDLTDLGKAEENEFPAADPWTPHHECHSEKIGCGMINDEPYTCHSHIQGARRIA